MVCLNTFFIYNTNYTKLEHFLEPFFFSIQVKFSVYIQYMRAIGWGYAAMVFLFYFTQNIAFIGQNLWLSDWTNDAVEYYNITYPNWKRDTRVGVFGALGVAQGN